MSLERAWTTSASWIRSTQPGIRTAALWPVARILLDAEGSLRLVIIGSGAGGGTIAQALRQWRANPDPRTRHLRAQKRRTGARSPSGRTSYRTTEHGRRVGGVVHAVLALLRWREHEFWGSVLYRFRREDFRLSSTLMALRQHAIDYETLEPYYERAEQLYQCTARRATIHRTPRRSPIRMPHPVRPRHGSHRRALREQGLHPSPCRLGSSGLASLWMCAVRYVQLVPVV